MIQGFYGELLFHPAALELSGYTCTNNCCYCFANNRKTSRDADWASVMNFIRQAKGRKTLEAALFNEGFPICISNLSDPFVGVNRKATAQIVKLLGNFPNGIFFQTKCTEGIEETLDALGDRRNAMFYITITCGNDDVSSVVESGAAVTSKRIETAIMLRKMGFNVVIGLNPLVENWMPFDELKDIAGTLVRNDIRNFFIQPMFLRRQTVAKFGENQRKAFFGFDEIDLGEWCEKRRDAPYCRKAIDYLRSLEKVNAFSTFSMYENTIHEIYKESMGKVFPMNFDFYQYVLATKNEEYTFDEFYQLVTSGREEFFEKDFPPLDAYVIRNARRLWKGHPANQKITNFRKLIRLYWNSKQFVTCPINCWELEESGRDSHGNVTLRRIAR